MKNKLCFVGVIFSVWVMVSVWGATDPVKIDGIPVIYTDASPYVAEQVYIPLRATLEEAGATVRWDEITRSIDIENSGQHKTLYVDQGDVTIEKSRAYIAVDTVEQKTGYIATLDDQGIVQIESGRVTNVETVPEESALILDVRTAEEFEQGHLEGAVNIPVAELESRLAELELYKDQPILVHCKSGGRSQGAVRTLRSHGFKHILHLYKGYDSIANK